MSIKSSNTFRMSLRDEMYAEGIEFGDYIVNEFLTRAAFVLSDPVLKKLENKLRLEVANHRKFCLDTLEKALFIQPYDLIPETPPTPKDVSRNVLAALKSSALLVEHVFVKIDSTVDVLLKSHKQKKDTGEEVGHNNSSSIQISESAEQTIPSSLRIIQNNVCEAPMKLFAVLDFNKGTPKRKYFTKKRRKSLGTFEKDGTFHAMAYGGFVHLCGGALEWPFKTGEINFSDFYSV